MATVILSGLGKIVGCHFRPCTRDFVQSKSSTWLTQSVVTKEKLPSEMCHRPETLT